MFLCALAYVLSSKSASLQEDSVAPVVKPLFRRGLLQEYPTRESAPARKPFLEKGLWRETPTQQSGYAVKPNSQGHFLTMSSRSKVILKLLS